MRPSRWSDAGICRQWFDEYAKEKDFDALDTEAWYDVKMNDLLKRQVKQKQENNKQNNTKHANMLPLFVRELF
jgi:cytidine deaminase